MKQTEKYNTMKTNLKSTDSHKTKMAVETIIWISAITFLFILFSFTNSLGNNLNFPEEEYINDIPFNTESVVNEMNLSDFDFEDETTITDIPFNTARIAANYNFQIAMTAHFEMEDENYINDIPFNTEQVMESYMYTTAISKEFQMSGEDYIDDIPFDTNSIAQNFRTVIPDELYVSKK
jgi:hypothetical protein